MVETISPAKSAKPAESSAYLLGQAKPGTAQSLVEEAGKGGFSTIHELVDWVEQSFGIHYTQKGMWNLVKRLKIQKKTARPTHVLKDEQASERF